MAESRNGRGHRDRGTASAGHPSRAVCSESVSNQAGTRQSARRPEHSSREAAVKDLSPAAASLTVSKKQLSSRPVTVAACRRLGDGLSGRKSGVQVLRLVTVLDSEPEPRSAYSVLVRVTLSR
jgi:hypothetical protein